MAEQLWNASLPSGAAPDTRILGGREAESRGEKACLSRPQSQLTFRLYFRDGRRRTIQYFNFVESEYESGRLRIYCHECTITILGRRLQEADDFLAEHKVYAFVEQHDNEFRVEANKETYIEKITISPPNLNALTRNPAG
jgi:hypothetical protein